MSNAEYVREVLLACPGIEAGPGDMLIDFLDQYPTRYSIASEPTNPIIKTYLGGDTLRRYSFALRAKFDVVSDEVRAANAKHYETLSLWLEQQSRRRLLPQMGAGASPRSIAATGNVFLEEREEDLNSGTYHMQIELTYYQKARL